MDFSLNAKQVRIYHNNDGSSAVSDVVITDTLPVSTTFLSFSGLYTPTLAGNQLIGHPGTVPGSDNSGYYGYLYATVHLSEDVPAGETVIIMTSNLGSEYLVGSVTSEPARELVMSEVKSHFRPEFLNRLDEIILFHPRSPEQLQLILGLMLKKEQKTARRPRPDAGSD